MTAPAAFSILPFDGDITNLPEPEAGPYLITTKSGYFVVRNFHWGRVLVPTKEAPMTPEPVPTIWHEFNERKLPHQLIGQAYDFFRAVYEQRKSEAMVDIVFNPDPVARERRRQRQGFDDLGYRLFVPPQVATGGGVKCERTPEHYNGQNVGTIHSHCNFGAFHSGTDQHDADGHDGLHITIGDVLKPKPSIAIMIAVSGIYWHFDYETIADGPLEPHPHPAWWDGYVRDPAPPKTTTWKPAGASTTTKAPQAPNPNTPTVVGVPPKAFSPSSNATDLGQLVWRYEGLFNANEVVELDLLERQIEQIRDDLARLDIEVDFDFTLLSRPARIDDDDTIWSMPQ